MATAGNGLSATAATNRRRPADKRRPTRIVPCDALLLFLFVLELHLPSVRLTLNRERETLLDRTIGTPNRKDRHACKLQDLISLRRSRGELGHVSHHAHANRGSSLLHDRITLAPITELGMQRQSGEELTKHARQHVMG
jgi:hypothetical protein